MHIILTHEQADFDAVASQLGAWLFDQQAIPVLPQRINRNVRAFLTIYGAELPFVERRDLPKEPIRHVTLVDTQSMTTLKGMQKEARVQVIDHHELRDDLPPHWNVSVQPTGATATLLVEGIEEQDIPLTVAQATLLLLGIYEDTGSLTYTRTTPRDLHAAAYLLEQGASLDIAANYLNHPLSLAQQAIFEQLLAGIETHHIHGYAIVIGRCDASQIDEELSTIAHKLRDLLDPDGLILLFTIRGGVQLIARSTHERVDVAGIAAHFGGGGHKRAAAAMIKEGDIEAVYRDLIEILPQHIRPPITVAQIMSHSPQLLAPDTPAAEAAARMQRYGYEGYPVVENGKVIGLLTRRAVDRALSHRLNLPAEKLMEAGEVTVHPHDSIEHLQQVMTDTGWGQIPVVDPDSGQIVGIVTRTDLLKNLAAEPTTVPGYLNLSRQLEEALPPGHLALLRAIAAMAGQQRCALYIVGGFVRDLLLGQPSLDFDLVVEGDAIALAKALARKYGGRVTTHRRFGTAKWFLDAVDAEQFSVFGGQDAGDRPSIHHSTTGPPLPATIDLITARTEFYTHPTALPTVERGSIKLDLHRRDFTINTLALRLDGLHYGELHDYWGGYNDLRQGLIRVLHSVSFVDDPTRMLRAVRFEQRFGFQIEARTLELLQAALVPPEGSGQTLLERVSGDRIRHELDHILDEPQAARMLARLHELGLLAAIHDAIPWDEWIAARIDRLTGIEPGPEWGLESLPKGVPLTRGLAYTLWFIRLQPGQARRICRRLKMSNSLKATILAACKLWGDLPGLAGLPPSAVVARLESVPPLALYAAWLACDEERGRDRLHEFARRWRHTRPQTTGHDLRALGLPPGPIYRQILQRLRAAWLDGEIHSADEEKALLGRLIEAFEEKAAP